MGRPRTGQRAVGRRFECGTGLGGTPGVQWGREGRGARCATPHGGGLEGAPRQKRVKKKGEREVACVRLHSCVFSGDRARAPLSLPPRHGVATGGGGGVCCHRRRLSPRKLGRAGEDEWRGAGRRGIRCERGRGATTKPRSPRPLSPLSPRPTLQIPIVLALAPADADPDKGQPPPFYVRGRWQGGEVTLSTPRPSSPWWGALILLALLTHTHNNR